MNISNLLADSSWDQPFFKCLAHNDTAQASGNVGGLVIPKALRPYFPGLKVATNEANPTTDTFIRAELYDGTTFIGKVYTRYQYQTWGAKRTPEARLTSNLQSLRRLAKEGDMLVFQRKVDEVDLYRLVLIRGAAAEFAWLESLRTERRWGVLHQDGAPPMAEPEYEEALRQVAPPEPAPFDLFDTDAPIVEKSTRQIARAVAFRTTVTRIYRGRCCVCDSGLKTPNGLSAVEAAHIVPRQYSGTDDVRNGLGLCRNHHWAFDKGLFGFDKGRRVVVPSAVLKNPANEALASFVGRPLQEAEAPWLIAADEALAWHSAHVLIR